MDNEITTNFQDAISRFASILNIKPLKPYLVAKTELNN